MQVATSESGTLFGRCGDQCEKMVDIHKDMKRIDHHQFIIGKTKGAVFQNERCTKNRGPETNHTYKKGLHKEPFFVMFQCRLFGERLFGERLFDVQKALEIN